jgi:hypothetical protein
MFEDPKPPAKVPRDPDGKPAIFPGMRYEYHEGTISVSGGKPVITLSDEKGTGIRFSRTFDPDLHPYLTTWEPVLYFIPDTAANPAVLKAGEELWVEVTIPRKGPPRPIQLALKSNGQWKPLNLN